MTTPRLAAYRTRLDTEPLTLRQLGAIHGEFERLGYRDPWDRADRLAITAWLARSGPVDSTKELTEGEAGRVIGALRDCPDLDALDALLHPPPPPPRPGLVADLVAMLRALGMLS